MAKKQVGDVVDTIIDTVYNIIEYKRLTAIGSEELPEQYENYAFGSQLHQEFIDLAKPLINKHEQVKEIEAESSRDVIKLLGKGKISAKEAADLLNVMKTKVEVITAENKLEAQQNLLNVLNK